MGLGLYKCERTMRISLGSCRHLCEIFIRAQNLYFIAHLNICYNQNFHVKYV